MSKMSIRNNLVFSFSFQNKFKIKDFNRSYILLATFKRFFSIVLFVKNENKIVLQSTFKMLNRFCLGVGTNGIGNDIRKGWM
jgi:hypothetical protein